MSYAFRFKVSYPLPGVRTQLHVRRPRGVRLQRYLHPAPIAAVRLHQDERVLSAADGRQPAGAGRRHVRTTRRQRARQATQHYWILAAWNTGTYHLMIQLG